MDETHDPPARFAGAVAALHDIVERSVDSTDFGPDDYLAGLDVLLQSMDETPFSARGRRIAWGMVITVLSGRVRAFRSMAENPGFDSNAIASPVVITGIPRTGTTALHKLMAVDAQFQGLQTWLLDAPMPRPPRETWEAHPMFQRAVAELEARYRDAPEKRAAHLMVAEEVDECCLLMRQSFVSNLWTMAWHAPGYDRWWQAQSELPAYRHLHRSLQLIGSTAPNQRWLLKNPGHIANLDLLFAVFPDAKVIQTHRDPAKAVPSLCALLMPSIRMMEEGDHQARAHGLLAREVEKWAKAVDDAEAVKSERPGQVLDVIHADFHRDPIAVIEQIYAFIGATLTPATAAAMARRIAEKPEMAHGVHRYDARDFGTNADNIRAAFESYVGQYGLGEAR